MSKSVAWAIGALVSSCLISMGGCPQQPVDFGADDSTRPAPGEAGPTQGGELLEGPGFTLTMPSDFVLKEQDTSHPGTSFWRYYEDTLGLRGIAVQVVKPSGAGVSNLEDVALRIKGAVQSATGDFLLIARVTTSGLPFEAEGTVGLLADGNILVVQIGSLAVTGVEELIATGLFTSIDLKDTDGRELEARWRDTSTTVAAKADNGMVVLSDLAVWSSYADATTAETNEVGSWSLGDAVFAQVLAVNGGSEHGELVHIGNWRPVEMYKVGSAKKATITDLSQDAVSLSDDTGWVVGPELASAWALGDTIFRIEDGVALRLVHAASGRMLVNPARVLLRPGFQVTLPSRSLDEMDDLAPPAGASYWRAFYDATEDVGYAIAVAAPDQSGVSTIEELSIRIRGSVTTGSGDFLLLARLSTGGFEGFEADIALALLANGDYLYVYLLADRIGASEELAGINVFTSVDLFDTDGHSLEDELANETPGLRVKASNDMLILDDLSVWSLPSSAPPADVQEVQRWTVGDNLINQSFREDFAFEDTYELVHVGNWVPVEVEFQNQAKERTIQSIDGNSLTTSDGTQWNFSGSVPSQWHIGDTVFRVEEGGFPLSEWLIHEESGSAVEFS